MLRLARCALDPDDDADVDVGEREDGQRQEVLQRHDDHRVGVALVAAARPHFVAEVAPIDAGDAGVDGDRERRGGGEQPRGADDRRRLGRRQARPQREDDRPVSIDADREHRERAQEHRHRLTVTEHEQRTNLLPHANIIIIIDHHHHHHHHIRLFVT